MKQANASPPPRNGMTNNHAKHPEQPEFCRADNAVSPEGKFFGTESQPSMKLAPQVIPTMMEWSSDINNATKRIRIFFVGVEAT
jgi:hypothetical protein